MTMEARRPDSELLALIGKISDRASDYANEIEQLDNGFDEKCKRYEMTMQDLKEAFYCLNRDDEWCHMTEVWRWLTYRDNEIEMDYEEF